MALIKTEKQINNLSKYSYDISKIIIAIIVISPLAKPETINLYFFGWGLVISIIFFIFGNMLDRKETKK